MRWVASLSNGQTVVEPPPVVGELSQWQQLRRFCAENGVHVTQIKLVADINNAGKMEFIGIKQADGYMAMHRAEHSLIHQRYRHYTGIGSVLGDSVYILWVGDFGEVKQDIQPAEPMMPHAVMKPGVEPLEKS